jgi:hypothetical protein
LRRGLAANQFALSCRSPRLVNVLLAVPPLVTEEDVVALLDAKHDRWKGDREGWVTLEHCGISWRVHYRRGELLEVGWWAPSRPPSRT